MSERWMSVSVLIVALVALVLAAHPDSGRDRRELRADEAHEALLLGAGRPFVVEYLWSKSNVLAREGRSWEVLDVFDRIARLENYHDRVVFNQAWWTAYNLAQSEVNEVERWRLYRRALGQIEAGLAQDPQSARLLELRFSIFLDHIAVDPFLDRQCLNNFGGRGLSMALRAAYELRDAQPQSHRAWDALRAAGEESAEWLLNRGRLTEARLSFQELGQIHKEMSERFPADDLTAAGKEILPVWVEVLGDLDAAVDWSALFRDPVLALRDPARLESAKTKTLTLWINEPRLRIDPEIARLDGEVIASIHLRIMSLCQALVLAKRGDLALSHLEWLAKLARLTEGRLGPRMPYHTEAYVSLFAEILAEDRVLRLGGAAADEFRARLESRIADLDRKFRARSRRPDNFVDRFRSDRFED